MRIRKIICIAVSAVIAMFVGVGVYFASSQGYYEYYGDDRSKSDTAAFNNRLSVCDSDPFVMQHDGVYYYCCLKSGNVYVSEFDNIYEINSAEGNPVWEPESESEYGMNLRSPRLHYIDGKWYIYVSAENKASGEYRILCLEGKTDDPSDGFKMKSVMRAETDRWAVDGTVLDYEGTLFFVWSGWDGNTNISQNIYIAEMKNPWTIQGDRVCISKPWNQWEKKRTPYINEAPIVLEHEGKTHIVYSANGSLTDENYLGLLTLTGKNILSKDSWTKSRDPVFTSSEGIFAPRNVSFITSPDGSRHYIVYRANEYSFAGRADVSMWIQEFEFDRKKYPIFGEPMPAGTVQYTDKKTVKERPMIRQN